MALPIKPKDTQDGCNPISSNCVIWQGPDIACINLCNGDSVSDVVAKLAEELCAIADQLDISLLDISCFGAISPTPADFRDVIQLLINNICNVEAGMTGGTTGGGIANCPDNCLVSVAQCLQPTDSLGNLVTELPLKDYLVLVANRICTIVSQINSVNSSIANIENRITVVEGTVTEISQPTPIDITSTSCVGNNLTQPIQTFVLALETTLCDLISAVGTSTEINQAIAKQCTVDAGPLDQAAQLNSPSSSMGNLPGWVPASSYNSLADAVNNIWLTVCDMREAVRRLQLSNLECCGVTCNDIDWTFSASGIRSSKFLDLYFSGFIPTGFEYCRLNGANIEIVDSLGNIGVYLRDIIPSINTGTPLEIDLDRTTALSSQAIWYRLSVPLDVCDNDTGLECNRIRVFELYNDDWCQDRAFTLLSSNVTPNVNGRVTISFTAASAVTTYNVVLYQVTPVIAAGIVIVAANSPVANWSFNNISGGNQSYTFPTLYTAGFQFYAEITSIQTSANYGAKQIVCRTEAAIIPN